LIDSAERAGVQYFVYTSYSGNIREDSPLETAKRDCEKRLLAAKMRATILRPSYFMEMWLSPALGFDPANGRARIYGSGEAKVSYISFHDVVAFALAVASNPSHPSAFLEMGGPSYFPNSTPLEFSSGHWARRSNWRKCPLLPSKSSTTPPILCKRPLPL